jgi:hypothetical protein
MKTWIVLLCVVLGHGCKGKAHPRSGEPAAVPTGSAAPGATPTDQALDAWTAATKDVRTLIVPSATAAVNGQRITQVIDMLDQTMRAASHDAWDPASVIAAVGKDRDALFKWVRDRTALVPYRGSLRGAVGVMMDRVGNSLDRALLLAELLKQAGIEVRLANAALEPDAAGKLATSWSVRSRPPLPTAKIEGAAAMAPLLKVFNLDERAVTDRLGTLEAARRQLVAQIRTRVHDQAAAIAKLVPAPGTAAVQATDPAALADHWWVQAHEGDAWTDLDPSQPDAEPGHALTSATETLAPDDLGDDRRHTLTVRVIGEVWHGESREQSTLLEHTFAPSQFYGQRMVVSNIAIDMPSLKTLGSAADPKAAVRAALIAQTEWIPLLRVGSGVVAKLSVTDGGELYDVMDANGNSTRLARAMQRATKAGVGGASDLLGTLPDGTADEAIPPRPPAAEHSGFTAEWIELELRAPGSEPKIVRRVVFDAFASTPDRAEARPLKLSDAMRLDRGTALVGETELLPMFARIPGAFVADRTVKALVAARPSVVELAKVAGTPAANAVREQIGDLEPVPGRLYGLALGRFEWSEASDQVYLDRLDVLTERQQLVATGVDLRAHDRFDIITNGTSVWPRPGTDPRAIQIAQGVADTAGESEVIGCRGGDPTCIRSVSTSDQFASSGGRGWRANPPALQQLAPNLRALAAADVADGYTLVVSPDPAGSPSATWWRVNPQTGETLGMNGHGGGVSAETAIIINRTLFAFRSAVCLVRNGLGDGANLCVFQAFFGFLASSLVLAVPVDPTDAAWFILGTQMFTGSLSALP